MAAVKQRVLREVEMLARVHTVAAINTLAKIASLGDETPWEDVPAGARISAANALLDRGWGRPSQTVTVDQGEDHMSDEELARHVEQRIAILAAAAGSGSGRSGSGANAAGAAEEKSSKLTPRLVH